MRRVPSSVAICAALSGLAFTAAAQQAPQLVIGGSQISSESSYTYLGVITPVQGARLGQGWFQKTVGSWLTYRYDTEHNGAPVGVRASAPGIETGMGYAWQGESLKGDVSLTVGVRHTRLRPADVPTDGPEGTQLTLTPQLAAGYQFSRTVDADLIASYSLGTRSRFARLRWGFQPGGDWRAGLEGVLSQGPDYRNLQRGVFVGLPLAQGWFIDVNAGQVQPRDGQRTPYVGLSFSRFR